MAISNFIDRIKIGDSLGEIAIGSSAYGECNTAADTAAKTVNIPGFTLNTGTTIYVKFINRNSASSAPTLNVSDTGAVPIMQYGTTAAGTADTTTGWLAGAIVALTYDGTNWVKTQGYNANTDTNPVLRTYASNNDAEYPLIAQAGTATTTAATAAWTEYTSGYGDYYGLIPSSNTTRATINPNTGHITVPGGITGDLTGTADVALKLTELDIGSATVPIYLDNGVATACNTYAGATKVTLNGTNYGAADASFYAPTTAGTQYQILVSDGATNKIPVWTAAATLQSETSTTSDTPKYTILTLGNSANVSSTSEHSEGKITLYSAATAAHIISGASTTNDYEHILPNESGWIVCGNSSGVADGTTIMYLDSTGVLTASSSDVGGPTQPVYLDNGVITEIEYTANRLYYSSSSSTFEAGTYYADGTGLAINKNTLTTNYVLEVNGNTKLLGDLNITGINIIGNIVPSSNNQSIGVGGNNPSRWNALYIGSADSYGGYGKPIYWNEGVPTDTFPSQYTFWTITGGNTSVTITETGKYFSDTKVIALVVTSGANNLNALLDWETNTNTLEISTDIATSGAVVGYAITARADDFSI